MADSFRFEPVWNGRNFSVTKGILGANDTLSSRILGSGSIVVVPGTGRVSHRISGSVIASEPVISQTGPNSRILWTQGDITEIVNNALKPVDLFRISMQYGPDLTSRSDELTLAGIDFLHGDWDDQFKASVRVDLDTIGVLGERLAQGSAPMSDEVQRAEWAREDLETKLSWYASTRNKISAPGPTIQISDTTTFSNFGGFAFRLPGFPPAGAAPTTSKGTVNVTVNTKDSGGALSSSWRVWTDLYAHGPFQTTAIQFPLLSTPTTDWLSVGRFWMWAEKGGQRGTASAFRIGNGNQTKQAIDLTVP